MVDKEIMERLEDIETTVNEMFSLMKEVYVPEPKKQIRELLVKHNGNFKAAVRELNKINDIRYGEKEKKTVGNRQ